MNTPDNFNQFRILDGPLASTNEAGENGAFVLVNKQDPDAALLIVTCVANQWEKITVTKQRKRMLSGPKSEEPNEADLRTVKAVFFKPEETAVEFHPHSKSALFPIPFHRVLWRHKIRDFPLPETERKVSLEMPKNRIVRPDEN